MKKRDLEKQLRNWDGNLKDMVEAMTMGQMGKYTKQSLGIMRLMKT